MHRTMLLGGKRKQNNSPVLTSGGSVGTEERSRLSKLKGRLSPVQGKDPSSRRVHFAEGSSAPSSPLRRGGFDVEKYSGVDADDDADAEVAACLDNALFVEVNAEITAALIATAHADAAAEAAEAAADAAAVAADTAASRQLVADAAAIEL
eukprot:scaffold48278_cov36-Phaeocystis_antarctica.AAC.1